MCSCPEKIPFHVMPLCRLSRAKCSNKFHFHQTLVERRKRQQTTVCYIGHVFLQLLLIFHTSWPKLIIIPFCVRRWREESLFFCNLLASSQSLRQWRLQQLIWDLRELTNNHDVTIFLRRQSYRIRQFTFVFCSACFER